MQRRIRKTHNKKPVQTSTGYKNDGIGLMKKMGENAKNTRGFIVLHVFLNNFVSNC